MSSWSIKTIDLEVGAVDRNLLESRKYGMTMKINAVGKQRDRKREKMQSPLKRRWREVWNRAPKNRWAEQGIFIVKMKKQADTG